MDIIPRMSRFVRRRFVRLGRSSGDPATVLGFLAVAGLAAGRSSPQVADEVHVARSTVVRAAHVFAQHGRWALFDGRCANGHRKADVDFRRHLIAILEHTPDHFG